MDSTGAPVGVFQYPAFIALQLGNEVVLTSVDLAGRRFFNESPSFYFASADCSGPALMYLDLLRYGSVNGTTITYPTGGGSLVTYNSFSDGSECSPFSGTATLGPVASASVAQFVAPFSLR